MTDTTTCVCPAYHRQHGFHADHCPLHHQPENPHGLIPECRAVFSYPPSTLGTTPDTYGPWRRTLAEAALDRVPRSEETLGWRTGFQRRLVTHPEPLPVLAELDAMPLLGFTKDEGERADLRALHGLWLDTDSMVEGFDHGPAARFSAVRTGKIVYREDGAAAEVYEVKRDWNQR